MALRMFKLYLMIYMLTFCYKLFTSKAVCASSAVSALRMPLFWFALPFLVYFFLATSTAYSLKSVYIPLDSSNKTIGLF